MLRRGHVGHPPQSFEPLAIRDNENRHAVLLSACRSIVLFCRPRSFPCRGTRYVWHTNNFARSGQHFGLSSDSPISYPSTRIPTAASEPAPLTSLPAIPCDAAPPVIRYVSSPSSAVPRTASIRPKCLQFRDPYRSFGCGDRSAKLPGGFDSDSLSNFERPVSDHTPTGRSDTDDALEPARST